MTAGNNNKYGDTSRRRRFDIVTYIINPYEVQLNTDTTRHSLQLRPEAISYRSYHIRIRHGH